MTRITRLEARPWNIELVVPFGIATGAQATANNVLVMVELDEGVTGLGEAAPFPAVNGDTQERALAALRAAAGTFASELPSCERDDFRALATPARAALSPSPSALAALEMAVLDACCKLAGRSLWEYFGATEATLESDITIPTGTESDAERAAARALEMGFSRLKVKVGGRRLDEDLRRLEAIARSAPDAELVLDANASLSESEAVELMRALGSIAERVVLFEQPTARRDLGALARVRNAVGCPVAADESAGSTSDVHEIARARAADVVNVKTAKCGLGEAVKMVHAARDLGLGLMIGGMVETELSMTVSACLAAGVGGFRFVDLDTPLFMRERQLTGGFLRTGKLLDVSSLGPGHGVRHASALAHIAGGELLC
jgi:L-alanine-DL-glutamate epimerase-like enolase superfamily enzyme